MAKTRMIDPMEVEAQKPAKCLTLRERQVIRNILADTVGKDTSTLVPLIKDYFKYREDSQFLGARIIQDDEKWLKVKISVGKMGVTVFEKWTSYEFKVRHPKNPVPTKFEHTR
mgnify:CR=1 FL=1|tara:strand:- start:46 stop:384 length:339 start_codon:yes stop_codon:yes gene_type:complete